MTTSLTSPKLMNHFMAFALCHDKSEFFHFFKHQWKIQDFGSAKGDPHVTLQFPISCSAARRLRSAYLKRWRPNRCGPPLCFVVGEKKHRPCEVGAVYDCFCYLEESSKKADAWICKKKTNKMRTLRNVGVSKNRGFSPQIIHFNRFFHYKPSILGYPYCTVQRLLGFSVSTSCTSSWGLCLAAQWFGSSFWLCRDSRCLIHFVAWDWPNRLRVFFFLLRVWSG